jgi:thermostable 8-oxoguanine DNA glycosylase
MTANFNAEKSIRIQIQLIPDSNITEKQLEKKLSELGHRFQNSCTLYCKCKTIYSFLENVK